LKRQRTEAAANEGRKECAEATAAERSFVKNSPLNLAPVRKFLQLLSLWRVSKISSPPHQVRAIRVLIPSEIKKHCDIQGAVTSIFLSWEIFKLGLIVAHF
jgi:hypothetical protein